MKKTIFSKVFSREWNRNAEGSRNLRAFLGVILIPLLIAACAKKEPEQPVIVKINGNPVYLNELEMLGGMAASEAGIDFNTPEGQQHYRKIAPNLYKTLIDIYVMKYAAEKEGLAPTPEEEEAEFVRFSDKLKKQGIYEEFLSRLQIDEKRLRETLRDRLAIQKMQKEKLDNFPAEVTDEEIRDYYHQNQKLFQYPYLMRASHIFISSPKTDPPEKREQARVRAEELRKMIGDDPSKTFVALAREHSEDKNTTPRGGDLGFIYSDGNLLESFKKAAFALNEGEVSGVVETEVGFHIIWATDRKETLEEAYPQVKELKIQQKKSEQFAQWIADAAKQMDIVKLFDPVQFKALTAEDAAKTPEPTPAKEETPAAK